MATSGRKRIHSAFSRALKGRGFVFDGDVATSLDNSIRVEFAGGEWNLFIANKLVLTHPMEAGSMKQLEHTVSVHRKKSSIQRLTKLEFSKRTEANSIIPEFDRITVRKINKQKGLDSTKDQRDLKQCETPTHKQVSGFFKGMIELGFIPSRSTKDDDVRTLGSGMYRIILYNTKGTWKLWSYDRLLGEGVCSSQGVMAVNNIMADIA